ncbi:addiction module toxin RelE [Niabella ginsenosidivorans]|uniref:Addiction module toxin RelE n=1 Tax=Niabella ginsenosidivorans TaxID=1176587 RepID=A0A1A9I2I4_9BACT|nr:type II toxin-antitoxin system HigB family toxin [Niabella ginsenosidivorans]ANH81743.1 addiction module toxin RelE [Niabella ginsenosidivorans]
MVIITKTTIEKYARRHTVAAEPLNTWYATAKAADWGHFPDVRNTFKSADYVGNNRIVFNIKGNDFRLIALVLFSTRTMFILWFGTHAEYDKINKLVGAKNIEYED